MASDTRQQRDTLQGEFGNFEHGLIQRWADREVHVRPKDDAAVAPGELARVAQAMYRALACLASTAGTPGRNGNGPGRVAGHATARRAVSANIHTPRTEMTCGKGREANRIDRQAARLLFARGRVLEGDG